MPPLKTPICDFGTNAKDFKLKSTNHKLISLSDIKGDAGTLIMFIYNHCPYVKAVIKDIVDDCHKQTPIIYYFIYIMLNNYFNIFANKSI